MDAQAAGGARPPRLNPFAFPSETDFRFWLLVVAVIGASLFLYDALRLHVSPDALALLRTAVSCGQIIGVSRLDPALRAAAGGADPSAFSAATAALVECSAPMARASAIWRLAGLTTLVLVAGAIYWCYPLWKTRRGRLVPLTTEDAPDVVAYLEDVCREAGLRRSPRFVWNPLSPATSPVAFGRFPQHAVALPGAFVTKFYTDQAGFRAVLLHELAHLRNGDVDKTYVAIATCIAFLLVAVLPYNLSQVFSPLDVGWLLSLGWRVLVLAAFVCLTGAAFLRTREVYADVRASVWDGPAGALRRVLVAPSPAGAPRWRNILHLEVHPDPATRRQFLDDTNRLFRVEFWDAFGAGLAATVAFESTRSLLSSLPALFGVPWKGFWHLGSDQIAALAAGLLFGSLAAGVVGVAVWRTTFAALMRGEGPRGVGRAGLALGLGALAGRWVSFEGTLAPFGGSDPVDSTPFVLWGAGMLIGCTLFVHWTEVGARAWLPAALRHRSPRPAYAAGLAIAGALLGLWVGTMLSVQYLGAGTLTAAALLLAGPLAIVAYVVQNPITALALVGIWAFPLAAWLWRRPPSRPLAQDWAFLDPPRHQSPGPDPIPIQLGRAARGGLLGGLVFGVLLLLMRIAVRLALSEASRSTDEFKLEFFVVQAALAVTLQGGMATVVAARVRPVGGAHGLYAAFVGGSLMALVLLGVNLVFGGTITPEFAWSVFSIVVNSGALLALPCALVGSLVASGLRRPLQQRSVARHAPAATGR